MDIGAGERLNGWDGGCCEELDGDLNLRWKCASSFGMSVFEDLSKLNDLESFSETMTTTLKCEDIIQSVDSIEKQKNFKLPIHSVSLNCDLLQELECVTPCISSNDQTQHTTNDSDFQTTREKALARYREKRLTRSFSNRKKYTLRASIAMVKPRVKGRFVSKQHMHLYEKYGDNYRNFI
uniref:CCT domain-containing protein n=2 Tax=Timspurckia oligopyrenoides TaxID=708627 RepID=A0A7S0ZAK0_9RHOD|mmetsp:Transcript_10363/g.18685  ORF Transcript_10363/g.18685 Transcript_10363/m.18685 type:complete len:180 (+) Transcript_10363:160-699(+)